MPDLAYPGHPVWAEIAGYFRPAEFRFPYHMSPDWLRTLYRVRVRAEVPMRVVSDYRPPERNEAAGGAGTSAHMDEPCRATDVRVQSSRERYAILAAAFAEGVRRIGVEPATDYQRVTWGRNSGTIHLDGSIMLPQDVCFMDW